MKAIITFDDKDDGVEVSVILEGGFNKDSHAHQNANICLNYLDNVAGAKSNESTHWTTADEVEQQLTEKPSMGEQIVGASSLVLTS